MPKIIPIRVTKTELPTLRLAESVRIGDYSSIPVDDAEAPEGWKFFRTLALRADLPNANGDFFPTEELLAEDAYKSFIGQHFIMRHRQHDKEAIRGKIFDAVLVKGKDPVLGEDGTWVEVLVGVDATKYDGLVEDIEAGKRDVSMGCLCYAAECNICGHKVYTDFDPPCTHIAYYKGRKYQGKPVYEIVRRPQFVELSYVEEGADIGAKIIERVATPTKDEGVVISALNALAGRFGFVVIKDKEEVESLLPILERRYAELLKEGAYGEATEMLPHLKALRNLQPASPEEPSPPGIEAYIEPRGFIPLGLKVTAAGHCGAFPHSSCGGYRLDPTTGCAYDNKDYPCGLTIKGVQMRRDGKWVYAQEDLEPRIDEVLANKDYDAALALIDLLPPEVVQTRAEQFPVPRFENCVKHFVADPDFSPKHAGDTKEEAARKLCAYIKEEKAGQKAQEEVDELDKPLICECGNVATHPCPVCGAPLCDEPTCVCPLCSMKETAKRAQMFDREHEQEYADWLDELAELPGGQSYALLLKKGDPTAYELGFNDWLAENYPEGEGTVAGKAEKQGQAPEMAGLEQQIIDRVTVEGIEYTDLVGALGAPERDVVLAVNKLIEKGLLVQRGHVIHKVGQKAQERIKSKRVTAYLIPIAGKIYPDMKASDSSVPPHYRPGEFGWIPTDTGGKVSAEGQIAVLNKTVFALRRRKIEPVVRFYRTSSRSVAWTAYYPGAREREVKVAAPGPNSQRLMSEESIRQAILSVKPGNRERVTGFFGKIRSRVLVRIAQLDSSIESSLMEFKEVQAELTRLGQQVKQLKVRKKELIDEVSPVMLQLEGQMAEVNGLIFRYKAWKRQSVPWKKIFDALIEKVNRQTRNVIEKLIAEFTNVTEVQKLEIVGKEAGVLEDIFNRIKGWLSDLVSGLRDTVGQLRNLETSYEETPVGEMLARKAQERIEVGSEIVALHPIENEKMDAVVKAVYPRSYILKFADGSSYRVPRLVAQEEEKEEEKGEGFKPKEKGDIEAEAKPKVKEMVEGGETNVDKIFDKLKSEMLLVKKDTIAAWVEEFGGEPAEEEKEEKEEEGGGVSEEAIRIDRKREEVARRHLLSQGKRLDPQTFIVELQKLKAMTDAEFEKTVIGKKPSILGTDIQSPLIRATVSKPLSGEEEGLGLVFSVRGRGGRVVNKPKEDVK